MGSANHFTVQLNWLENKLRSRGNHIRELLLRLTDIGTRLGTSLLLHRKFMRLMEQVAIERRKEMRLIYEIEEIEERHRLMRKCKLLRRADNRPLPKVQKDPAYEPQKAPKRLSILSLFGLAYLLSSSGIKHKNQTLTVD